MNAPEMTPVDLEAIRTRNERRKESWKHVETKPPKGGIVHDIESLFVEIERLQSAIRQAIGAAEEEGIDRHRGTDEPRRFVTILRGALGGRAGDDGGEETP